MRWPSVVLLALCLVLITAPHFSLEEPVIPNTSSIASTPTQIQPQQAQVPRQQVPICSVFYVWYGFNETSQQWQGGNLTSHWNDQPERSFLDKPLTYYSSMDNETLRWQLSEMHRASLDCIIVSWWGEDDYTNEATVNLFRYVHATNDSIKIAIMVEPYNGLNVSDAEDYVERHFYSVYLDHVFIWLGKPLLAWFLPSHPAEDVRFTIRTVGNGIADWQYVAGLPEYVDGTNKPPEELALYTNGNHTAKDGEVTVTPRFDNYYEYQQGGRPDYLRLDVNYTGMFQKLWAYAQANASLIVVSTWNEMTESSVLEPYINANGQMVCPVGLLWHGTSCLSSYELPSSVLADMSRLATTPKKGVLTIRIWKP